MTSLCDDPSGALRLVVLDGARTWLGRHRDWPHARTWRVWLTPRGDWYLEPDAYTVVLLSIGAHVGHAWLSVSGVEIASA